MQSDQFQPSLDSEARVLLLVEAFSRGISSLEGRTKLAKLDFFLRYPVYLQRALSIRRPEQTLLLGELPTPDIETRMVRYKYGPWDPAYYSILGRLLGKKLIHAVPVPRGIGYRITDTGREIAGALRREPIWRDTSERLDILRKHFNLNGTRLKNFIYQHFPEVTQASWGEIL